MAKRRNWLRRWLEESAVATVCVAVAAVLGFLISTLNGLWTVLGEIEKRHAKASIIVESMTLGPRARTFDISHLYQPDTIDSAAKGGHYVAHAAQRGELAFYDATVLFSNPRKDSVTFRDCRLDIYFLNDESNRSWGSVATIEPTADFEGVLSRAPLVFFIAASEAKAARLRFLYVMQERPESPFRYRWRTNDARPSEFYVTCLDASGRVIESVHERVDIGGREMEFRRRH